MLIDPKRIRENPLALRGSVDQRLVDRLEKSISKLGVQSPIMVCEVPRKGLFWFLKHKNYVLLDGFHRLQACLNLGMKKVPCQVFQKRKA